MEQAALTTLVTAPLLAAAAAASLGRRMPALTARLGALAAACGVLVAAWLASVAADGRTTPIGPEVLGFAVDRLSAALLLLIFGVSAVTQAFAVRYLAGDPRLGWFTFGAGLLTAASTMLVTATTVVGLAAAWTAAGLALCLLLGTYWSLPTARDGVRRTAIAFAIGDVALWTAVGLISVHTGTVSLAELRSVQIGGPLGSVIAALVVVAALSRSAQIPFHRWLPATLSAPTPVSALLHAGVVNAGGILLVRLSPALAATLATVLLVTAGAATLAYGAVVMLVKPDVKGALAYSTMAQMGFMILSCGLGLWAAAVIHLIAHGFYKATLFLSSGSAIARGRRHAAAPPPPRLTGRRRLLSIATATALPLLALFAAVLVVPIWPDDHAAELALLLFAWATGALATWGWLRHRPGIAGALTAAGVLTPIAVGYVAVVSLLSGFLTPALPATTVPAATAWTIVTVAVIVLAGLASVRLSPTLAPLRRTLYARALSAGTVHPHMSGAPK